MLRVWCMQHFYKNYKAIGIARSFATEVTNFRKLLHKVHGPSDPPAESTPAAKSTSSTQLPGTAARIEDGKFVPKSAASNQPSTISGTGAATNATHVHVKVEDAFRRAAERQRQESMNRFRKHDTGTNYANASFGNKPNSVPAQSNQSHQRGGGGTRQPQQQQPSRKNMPRRTGASAVQHGRGVNAPGHQPVPRQSSGNNNQSKNTNNGPSWGTQKKPTQGPRAVSELEDGLDAMHTDPPDIEENTYKQKQIAFEKKKKELDELLSNRPTGPHRRQGPPAAQLFPSADGPLSVADLRRIAAERLQQNTANLPADTYVDYKEVHRAQRHNRMNLLKAKRAAMKERLYGKKRAPVTVINEIKIPHNGLTLREVAQRLSMKMSDVVDRFATLGETITEDANDMLLDPDVVELLALELGLEVVRQEAIYRDATQYIKSKARAAVVDDSELTPRLPVVSVMGHVDHGKTTLLDFLRHNTTLTAVAGKEAGGITQRLSAFNVEIGGRKAVMLDTPGHAAFSSMRRKGSNASDIVVLVVAVDDGVRPQTVEAIKMAKKGDCAIVVVLNKIDKFTSESERETARRRVLGQLVECDVTAEEFGGDVQVVEASAKTGEGVDSLVEQLLFQADLMDLKGYSKGPAEAVVLDAKMEQGRGVVVDVLVKWGVLKVGDPVVVNTSYGRVRSLLNEHGKTVKSAGPSTPVRIMGLKTVPAAGQELLATPDESKARKIAERRQKVEDTRRINDINRRAQELENTSNPVVIRVVLKADSTGALNALRNIVDGLADRADEVSVHVIGQSVGDVNPSDVTLAAMVDDNGEHATILGFNIKEPAGNVRALLNQHDVKVIQSDVVYRLEEALEGLMVEHMPEERHMTVEGVATVLQLFEYKAKQVIKVAGLQVTSGVLRTSKNHIFCVKREASKVPVPEGAEPPTPDAKGYVPILMESSDAHLKRFKDSVDEVKSGLECGFSIDDYSDFMPGDIIECCRVENKFKSLVVQKYSQEMQYGQQMQDGVQAKSGDNSDDEDGEEA